MKLNPTAAAAPGPARVAESPATRVLLRPWKEMVQRRGLATLRYLTRTEAHTFAFSVAANAVLSFFPFMVLLGWLVRNVFHSTIMSTVLGEFFRSLIPIRDPDTQDFIARNLKYVINAQHRVRLISIVMLLISSSGVFLPLEVAFNKIWGFGKDRSYLGNQLISLFLAFACGVLALLSVSLAAGHEEVLSFLLRGSQNIFSRVASSVVLEVVEIVASIAIFYLIYWLLPNGKVPARSVLPAAVAMGILWEFAKYAYILALPWLKFRDVYGPFYISITLMFWAFISGLLVLAGAHLTATPQTATKEEPAAVQEVAMAQHGAGGIHT